MIEQMKGVSMATNENHQNMTTSQLMNIIQSSPKQFRQSIPTNKEPSINFIKYLENLMEQYHCSTTELIIYTGLSKTFVYQIMSDKRLPGRDVIIRIALALKLTLEETQKLLTLAQKGILYPRVRRDAAILCCIQNRCTMLETAELLEELGEVPLL